MTVQRVALVGAVLLLVAAPAAAHGNYVSSDAQVSADGTVRIEFLVIVTDGFVVLHADDDGEPGAVIGHRGFDDGYVQPDYAVRIDPGYWQNQSGNLTVWAVLHRDTGDRQFDSTDDPPLTSGEDGSLVGQAFTIRKSDAGPVTVAAERDEPQETDRNLVKLRSVRLATDGYVVVRADAGGEPGRVVGTTALGAGTHTNVAVTIDETFYEHRPEDFTLWAVVHESDGDGAFDASTDRAVTAGGSPVMTRFDVERTDPIEHMPTAVPDEHTELVTETESGHGDHQHTEMEANGHDRTHTSTAGSNGTDTSTTAAEHSHDHETASPTAVATTSTPGQPGFGFGLAVAALLALSLARKNRR